MKQLHPVFNMVKLTPAPDDLITGWKTEDHPLPIVINGEAKWEVEEILDSRWHWRRFQYLIKWKGYGCEHSSWKSASEVSALELTVEFHRKHPRAPRHIRHMEFVTNFIWPYLHQFSIDSHGLNGYGKPLKRPFDRYQLRLEAISNGRDIRQINW